MLQPLCGEEEGIKMLTWVLVVSTALQAPRSSKCCQDSSSGCGGSALTPCIVLPYAFIRKITDSFG